MQPLFDNSDVSIWKKNDQVGWKIPNKQTKKKTPQTNKQTNKHSDKIFSEIETVKIYFCVCELEIFIGRIMYWATKSWIPFYQLWIYHGNTAVCYIEFTSQAESSVLESQLWDVKTGNDSSNAKRSAIGVSVAGPRRWPL